jgi:hypothetical protein
MHSVIFQIKTTWAALLRCRLPPVYVPSTFPTALPPALSAQEAPGDAITREKVL